MKICIIVLQRTIVSPLTPSRFLIISLLFYDNFLLTPQFFIRWSDFDHQHKIRRRFFAKKQYLKFVKYNKRKEWIEQVTDGTCATKLTEADKFLLTTMRICKHSSYNFWNFILRWPCHNNKNCNWNLAQYPFNLMFDALFLVT